MQPSQIPVLYESADLLVAEPEFLELPECDQTAVLPKRASHPTNRAPREGSVCAPEGQKRLPYRGRPDRRPDCTHRCQPRRLTHASKPPADRCAATVNEPDHFVPNLCQDCANPVTKPPGRAPRPSAQAERPGRPLRPDACSVKSHMQRQEPHAASRATCSVKSHMQRQEPHAASRATCSVKSHMQRQEPVTLRRWTRPQSSQSESVSTSPEPAHRCRPSCTGNT